MSSVSLLVELFVEELPYREFKKLDKVMMQDSGENFDRIAPHITRRLGEWRRGAWKPARD
ncbi:MAG: hypothetical protein FWC42_07685 [Proteobacteria bacterium]|nr:hypothetical protein [Pseudomonadota bacterium]